MNKGVGEGFVAIGQDEVMDDQAQMSVFGKRWWLANEAGRTPRQVNERHKVNFHFRKVLPVPTIFQMLDRQQAIEFTKRLWYWRELRRRKKAILGVDSY